jgi:hypothetical protein
MALVSTSQVVTDQSATPRVKTNSLEKGGVVRTAQGFLAAASYTGGTTGQWYTFVRVPARARVLGVFLSQLTTTTGAVKVGLYRPDGIAIDDDCFASVHVLGATTNVRARVDINTVYTPSLRQSALSTAFVTAVGTAGATSDTEYDIAAAIVTVIGTPTDALLEVDYVLPE